MQNFSVQGLSDTLTALDTELTMIQPPSKEYALLLEVTMADCLGHWHPPTFSWNAGMVIHVLKGDPTLKDLEHVQVDGPGTVYLFFFDKQGCKELHSRPLKPSGTMWGEVFAEWISHSAHFAVILLPLVEGWCQAVTTSEWCCQISRSEYQGCPMMNFLSSESDSTPQLVGSTPPSMVWISQVEEAGGGRASKMPTS